METLTADQLGKTVDVVASYVDGHGTAESVASSLTSTVLPPPPPSVSVANNGNYSATAGQVDTFVIDASQTINATIAGFANGDILQITHRTANQGINFTSVAFNDGAATLIAGNATVDLTGLPNDLFNNESSFDKIYGPTAIAYVVI